VSGKVTLKEDVVVGEIDGRPLHCDVFVPPEATEKATAVLLIHGGAWVMGDKSQLRGYGFLLGREGTVCVACEYRLATEAQWPAQLDDVNVALQWMHDNAEELGIDPQRIAVCGASSGAHLAMMAAASHDESADRPPIAAVISFYGPTRLRADSDMLKDSVLQLLGSDAKGDDFVGASPADQLSASYPPTLLMHSNQDELVPREQSIEFAEQLRALEVPVELALFDNVPHMFDADKRLGRLAANLAHTFLSRYVGSDNG